MFAIYASMITMTRRHYVGPTEGLMARVLNIIGTSWSNRQVHGLEVLNIRDDISTSLLGSEPHMSTRGTIFLQLEWGGIYLRVANVGPTLRTLYTF